MNVNTLPLDVPARLAFSARVLESGAPLRRGPLRVLQVNVGKRCNQACEHCHVEAGPSRTESMDAATVDQVVRLIETLSVECVDITGGAPELHPQFRRLAGAARAAGKQVIDRCNLTVLFEPGQEDLDAFLAGNGVEVVASLPCYLQHNVERQRGLGVWDKSIAALQRLNARGYGRDLPLFLVYNPVGPFLPPPPDSLEQDYRERLHADHGILFTGLYALANMPVRRFRHALERDGGLDAYMAMLENAFNAATLPHLMCRETLNVGWDGGLYDCDFNQMLDMPLMDGGRPLTVWNLDAARLADLPIATANHCYGCTAGSGSSCGGALVARD